VFDSGSVEYSRNLARRHVDAALASLADLPASSAKASLETIAHVIIDRRR
jgi:geranylgeranyl pyrophosphate synthase